jgi:hypothetical protein
LSRAPGDMMAQDSLRVGSNWVLDSAASLLKCGLPTLGWIIEPDGLGIERVRVESTAGPSQYRGSLGMPTIGDGS